MEPLESRQFAQHVPSRFDMNLGCHVLGKAPIVAREATGLHRPGKGPLKYRSLQNHLETCYEFAAFGCFNFQAGLQLRHMGGGIGATDAAVDLESLQSSGRGQHFLEQFIYASLFRYVGGKHGHPEHVGEGVDAKETLSAQGFSCVVVAGVLGDSGGGDFLAFEDSGCRPPWPTHLLAAEGADLGVNQFEDVVSGSGQKEAVGCALGWEVSWQGGPPTSSFRDVRHGVQDATEAGSWPPSLLCLGEERFEFAPLILGEIGVADDVFIVSTTAAAGEIAELGQRRRQRKFADSRRFLWGVTVSESSAQISEVWCDLSIKESIFDNRDWCAIWLIEETAFRIGASPSNIWS